jgi:hypothetical protein
MSDTKGDTNTDTKSFSLRLPADLVAKVDARAKEKNISRNEWYERMTRWTLANAPVSAVSDVSALRGSHKGVTMRHDHDYERGELDRHSQGIPLYRYECECGDTRVGP